MKSEYSLTRSTGTKVFARVGLSLIMGGLVGIVGILVWGFFGSGKPTVVDVGYIAALLIGGIACLSVNAMDLLEGHLIELHGLLIELRGLRSEMKDSHGSGYDSPYADPGED